MSHWDDLLSRRTRDARLARALDEFLAAEESIRKRRAEDGPDATPLRCGRCRRPADMLYAVALHSVTPAGHSAEVCDECVSELDEEWS